MSTNQSSQPDFTQIILHQFGISVAEAQTWLSWRNIPSGEEWGEMAVFEGCSRFNQFNFRIWRVLCATNIKES